LVTIVTPCLNRASRVATAIESVRWQTYAGRIEHVVVDGGSTDGTLDVLRRYDNLIVVSERDKNAYDALNRGIAKATGQVIGFLNSDDMYLPCAVADAVARLEAAPNASMACGGADVIDDEDRVLVRHDTPANRSVEVHDILFSVPLINARFFRRPIFDRVGLFDIRFAVAGDREFLLRAALANEIATPVPGILYRYRHHAGSLTIGGSDAWNRIADDHMYLAEESMGRASRSASAARELRRFHAQSVLMGMIGAARRGDMGAALACAKRGARLNAWWPVEAPHILAAWISRRLAREPRGAQ
jgi:glycosyltransferase involved in cell wall biosynthesis